MFALRLEDPRFQTRSDHSVYVSEDNVWASEPWLQAKPAMALIHASKHSEAMQVNLRVTQLLRANHFKMGA